MKRCLVRKDFTMRGRGSSGQRTQVFRKGEILYLDKNLVPEPGEGADPVTFDRKVPLGSVLLESRKNTGLFDRYETALADLESAKEASVKNDAALADSSDALAGTEEIGEIGSLLGSYMEKAMEAFRSSLDLDTAEAQKKRALRQLMAS